MWFQNQRGRPKKLSSPGGGFFYRNLLFKYAIATGIFREREVSLHPEEAAARKMDTRSASM
jgi:hypothetical protein